MEVFQKKKKISKVLKIEKELHTAAADAIVVD